MHERKGYFITVAIATAISIVFSVALFLITLNINDTLDKLVQSSGDLDVKVSALIKEESEQSENMFMLKEYNGIIGVFNESGELTDIIEVDIKSLPRQDQTMLTTGIWATSRQELAALIEDYTG